MELMWIALPVILFILVVTVVVLTFLKKHNLQYLRFLRAIADWRVHVLFIGVLFVADALFDYEIVHMIVWDAFILYAMFVLPLTFAYTRYGRREELEARESKDESALESVKRRRNITYITVLVLAVLLLVYEVVTNIL